MIFRTTIIGFLIVIVAVSCKGREKKAPGEVKAADRGQRAVNADGIVVVPSDVYDYIEIPGNILANETTAIHPELAGIISSVNFKEGSFLRKGDLLFRLNDAELQAQLKKLQLQEKMAAQNESRSAELIKIGGISKQDYEMSQLTTGNVSSDIALIKVLISKMNIRAPFNGKVGLRMVSVGTYINPATVLTTISEIGRLKLDFPVPEKYTDKIKEGQLINFGIDANQDNYSAKILATEPGISEDTRTLHVRALITETHGLLPGTFAKVKLRFAPQPNSIMIPSQAIVPDSKGKKVFTYANGIASSKYVSTGYRDSINVQIINGLKMGDTVLVTGLLSLRPNSKVTLAKLNGKLLDKKKEYKKE